MSFFSRFISAPWALSIFYQILFRQYREHTNNLSRKLRLMFATREETRPIHFYAQNHRDLNLRLDNDVNCLSTEQKKIHPVPLNYPLALSLLCTISSTSTKRLVQTVTHRRSSTTRMFPKRISNGIERTNVYRVFRSEGTRASLFFCYRYTRLSKIVSHHNEVPTLFRVLFSSLMIFFSQIFTKWFLRSTRVSSIERIGWSSRISRTLTKKLLELPRQNSVQLQLEMLRIHRTWRPFGTIFRRGFSYIRSMYDLVCYLLHHSYILRIHVTECCTVRSWLCSISRSDTFREGFSFEGG